MEKQEIASNDRRGSGSNPYDMTKVLLLQFGTDPACGQRREILQKVGVSLAEAEPRWPTFFDAVNSQRPEIIIIAGSTIPSHAFEAARYLGEGFNTRDIPVLLVDVATKDLARARESAPRARIVEGSALGEAVMGTLDNARK